MPNIKHKVFISYHSGNDQGYKEALLEWNESNNIFIDASVDTDDIDDNLSDERIRQKIRDEYLKDSSVTILLVGTETKKRKHVDWEIYSSMYDGKINKKSGVLVINLPTVESEYFTAAHEDPEKLALYPNENDWINITSRTEYERRYPHMPARIIDNLLQDGAKVSVAKWSDLTVNKLRLLIELTYNDRASCSYDLSTSMRRENS